MRMNSILSISSLTKAKYKNQVQLEIGRYMEQLRREATRDDLELNACNMQKYIGGPVKVNIILLMLQNELDIGLKTIDPNVMEERVHFQKDIIKQFGDTITQYQAWH